MPILPTDWHLIRMRYEAGQSAYKISNDLGGKPTKQGIAKRAKREGWQKGTNTGITVAAQLPIVERAKSLSGPTKCSAERVGIILDHIARGAPKNLAAAAAGISAETLRNWERQDGQLAEQMRIARAAKLTDWFGHIDSAAERDWKAAETLLKASDEVEGFKQGNAHGGITVVLNIDRDADSITLDNIVSEQ